MMPIILALYDPAATSDKDISRCRFNGRTYMYLLASGEEDVLACRQRHASFHVDKQT